MPTTLEPHRELIAALREDVTAQPALDTGALAHRLYLTVHCRVADEGQADRGGFARLMSTLRRDLAALARPHAGFRHGGGSTLTAPDGVPVQLPDGTRTATGPDGRITVYSPGLSVPTDGRWVYWSSPGLDIAALDTRLYCNPDPATAAASWTGLVRGLHRAGVPAQTKLSTRLGTARRADGIVVYLPGLRAAHDAAGLLRGAAAPGTPAAGFGWQAGPGLCVADRRALPHGHFDVSYGYWWAAALAEAWAGDPHAPAAHRAAAVDAELGRLAAAWSRISREWADAAHR